MSVTGDIAELDQSRFVEFDPYTEEVRQNWESYAEEWAGREAVYAMIHGERAVIIARDADIHALYVGEAKRYQSAPVLQPLPDAFYVHKGLPNLSAMDGEDHQRVRRAMQPAFGKDGVGLHQTRIDVVVGELLDEISFRGEAFNAAADFSQPVLWRVLLREMFGLDEDKMRTFVRMSRLFPTVFTEGRQTEQFIEAREAAAEAIEEVIADRRRRPKDDFIGLMTAAEGAGAISHDELVGNLFGVCVAALESTSDSMSHLLLAKCRLPDQFALVRADLDLVPSAVEESLRLWNAEYMSLPRYAIGDTEIGGLPIPRGMVVFPFIAAGNRDPERYEDPTVFDAGRNPVHHHAFARGAHHCVGSILARCILQRALRALLTRYPDFHLADEGFEPTYSGIAGQLTITSVPMVLGPAA